MQKFLKKKFDLKDGIYNFNVNDPSTKSVTEFYRESPFPNYKKADTKSTILEKGNKNFFALNFKKKIGYNKNVLEVGCGTGQLSIYFSIGNNNNIVGLDPTIESLQLGKKFIDKNNLKNINFVRADIFDDVLKDNIFDFIWCNGVLHHTKNPSKAFDILIKSLKKEGYVLIGLYNKIGRIRTLIRKYLYKLFGLSILRFLDPTLKNLKIDEEEKNSWIRDQYLHPIESLHTIDDVLGWFKRNNIKFISSIPSSDLQDDYENVFKEKSTGSRYLRLFSQFFMIFNKLGSDGGLFVVIGKKL
jgi:ubiquinone/menaquinone biosynthesis C-methylase UbiE